MKHLMKFVVLALFVSGAVGLAKADTGTDASKKPTEVPATHLTHHQLVEKLQLTDDQQKQLRHLRATYRTGIAKLEGQIKVKKVELENELDKPEPDAVKLNAMTQELGNLYGQRLNLRVKTHIELTKKILTAQQADMLKSIEGKESSDDML